MSKIFKAPKTQTLTIEEVMFLYYRLIAASREEILQTSFHCVLHDDYQKFPLCFVLCGRAPSGSADRTKAITAVGWKGGVAGRLHCMLSQTTRKNAGMSPAE